MEIPTTSPWLGETTTREDNPRRQNNTGWGNSSLEIAHSWSFDATTDSSQSPTSFQKQESNSASMVNSSDLATLVWDSVNTSDGISSQMQTFTDSAPNLNIQTDLDSLSRTMGTVNDSGNNTEWMTSMAPDVISGLFLASTESSQNTLEQTVFTTAASADNEEIGLLSVSLQRFGLGGFILGVNILTIVTFCRKRTLRTLSSMLPVSLAAADILVGILTVVGAFNFIPALYTTSNSQSVEFCVIRLNIMFMSVTISMVTISLISVERYLFIVHPYKHIEYVNAKVLGIAITASWVGGTAFGFSPVLFYDAEAFETEGCDLFYVIGPEYAAWACLTVFLVTSGLTLVFYSLIAKLVMEKRRSNVMPSFPATNETSGSRFSGESGFDSRTALLVSKLRALKSPLVVFGAFLLSWLPHFIVYFLQAQGLVNLERQTRANLSNVGLFNSAINFFVYLIFNRQFREALPLRKQLSRVFGILCFIPRFIRRRRKAETRADGDNHPTQSGSTNLQKLPPKHGVANKGFDSVSTDTPQSVSHTTVDESEDGSTNLQKLPPKHGVANKGFDSVSTDTPQSVSHITVDECEDRSQTAQESF